MTADCLRSIQVSRDVRVSTQVRKNSALIKDDEHIEPHSLFPCIPAVSVVRSYPLIARSSRQKPRQISRCPEKLRSAELPDTGIPNSPASRARISRSGSDCPIGGTAAWNLLNPSLKIGECSFLFRIDRRRKLYVGQRSGRLIPGSLEHHAIHFASASRKRSNRIRGSNHAER